MMPLPGAPSSFLPRAILLALLALPLVGCSVLRGLPTHGGGKRFDEEQWAVSGSARRSVASMDLKELKGKRVQVVINSVAHNGGGMVEFPGIEKLAGTLNGSETRTDFGGRNFIEPQFASPAYRDSDTVSKYKGLTGGVEIDPRLRYVPTVFGTDSDLEYLRAAVFMKCAHDGVYIVTTDPEVYLVVLVDVFGTNLSRKDSIVAWTDRLEARCDLTYYAQVGTTADLVIPARRTSSECTYKESSMVAFAGYRVRREAVSLTPDDLPVNEVTTPETK